MVQADFGKRILAIVKADYFFRFRRPASIITFLLIAAGVYLVVPDFREGNTLMQIDNHRVVYNSAAVALGTAMFCAMFLSIVGFYLISNSFRRDIKSRTAYIIASTPTSTIEYIFGKFLGNLIYLMTIMIVCMLSAMVMFLIRGETALEPFVFLEIYLWLVMPCLIFGSAAALVFESVPALAGRFGDVLYFFIWSALTAIPAVMMESKVENIFVTLIDVLGMIPAIMKLQEQFHTTSISIGASTFDPLKEPILFSGISWSAKIIFERFITLILPGIMFLIACISFHRFDPTKIKASIKQSRRSILNRLNGILKPINSYIEPLLMPGGTKANKQSFVASIRADIYATLMLAPYVTISMIIFALLSIVMDGNAVLKGLLPAIVLVLTVTLADIVPRDGTTRMMNLLMTTPAIKKLYVWWKFLSALIITLCFTIIPIIHISFVSLPSAVSILIGSCLISAGAVAMGFLTRSTKLFVATFLMLLYIALNSATEPMFDFFGFLGKATPLVQCSYALIAVALIALANARHRFVLSTQ